MNKKLLFLLFTVVGTASFGQTISSFPWVEDFETQPTGPTGSGPIYTFTGNTWMNGDNAAPASAGHDVDWTVDVDGTSSTDTGPSVDHTLGTITGRYIYAEASGNGTGYPNVDFHLVSPYLNFSAIPSPSLSFWRHQYGSTMGNLYVDTAVGANGAWGILWGPVTDNQNLWKEADLSLIDLAGTDSVRVRFRFISGSDFFSDCALDDISVYQVYPKDIAVASIDGIPPSGCNTGISTPGTTLSEIGLSGHQPGDSLIIMYMDDMGNTIVDTVVLTSAIAPGGTYVHTFSQSVDYSTLGTYNINVTVWSNVDSNLVDNTMTASLTSVPSVSTFPYLEDFENGRAGWQEYNTTNGATNGNWEFGTPAQAQMNSAFSGDSCFATGLTSNYSNSANAWVESPCFDLTQATGTEHVALAYRSECENSWDGSNITFSTDNGTSWTLLGNFGDPNWYNDNTINGGPAGYQEGWTGENVDSWVHASHSIPTALFAESSVRFRVNFGSDASVTLEGFAFDNFAVAAPPVFDPFADTISICDTILGAAADPGLGWDAYSWSTGETTQFSQSQATGWHWVDVLGTYGVWARDSVFIIRYYTAPELEDYRVVCYPDTTQLDAGADALISYNYMWSTGDTSQIISVNTPGFYSVEKSDESGNCILNDTIEVEVAQVDLGNATIVYCPGNEPILDAGPGGVDYLWNTTESTQTIQTTGPGAYSVTVIDTNECLLIDVVYLVESYPVVDLGDDQTICVNGSTTLDAGNPGGTYDWSDASTTQIITVDGATVGTGTYNYSVNVTDSVGCVAIGSVVITVDACAGIEGLVADLGMAIYPNPSSGVFNYTVGTLTDGITMTVTDITGKVVVEDTALEKEGTIDLSPFESGVYIVNVTDGMDNSMVRVIKQ